MVDVLLLDIAGTVLIPTRKIEHVYAEALQHEGIEVSQSIIAERFPKAFRAQVTKAHSMGSLAYGTTSDDARAFWSSVFYSAVKAPNPITAEYQRAFQTALLFFRTPRAWTFRPEALALLREAKAAAIPVIAVSNWDIHLRPLLNRLGLTEYFYRLVISAEVGIEKPNPQIYQRAMNFFPAYSSSQFLMIGDHPVNDIAAARSLGCETLLINPASGHPLPSLQDI